MHDFHCSGSLASHELSAPACSGMLGCMCPAKTTLRSKQRSIMISHIKSLVVFYSSSFPMSSPSLKIVALPRYSFTQRSIGLMRCKYAQLTNKNKTWYNGSRTLSFILQRLNSSSGLYQVG